MKFIGIISLVASSLIGCSSGHSVSVDGVPIPASEVGGHTYVRITDVAKAANWEIKVSPNGDTSVNPPDTKLDSDGNPLIPINDDDSWRWVAKSYAGIRVSHGKQAEVGNVPFFDAICEIMPGHWHGTKMAVVRLFIRFYDSNKLLIAGRECQASGLTNPQGSEFAVSAVGEKNASYYTLRLNGIYDFTK